MSSVADRKKIVLFSPNHCPAHQRPRPWYYQRVPLQLLALARVFDPERFDVRVIDAKMDDDFENTVMNAVQDAVCLGVTSLVGFQIKEGRHISQMVKREHPDLPIVWGGWFPSLMADETINDPDVDYVVRGQGELTFQELVDRFLTSGDVSDVQGITYKRNGEVVTNGPRPLADINDFSTLPYDLLDMESYLRVDDATRTMNHYTSVGCPYECTFCSDPLVYNRRRVMLEPPRIVDEWEMLVKKYGVTHITLDDPTFFLSKKRTRRICELMIERGLEGKVFWHTTGNGDRVAGMEDDLMHLVKRGGCEQIYIGVESGSPETLKELKKASTLHDIETAAKKTYKQGISILASFLVGNPVEEKGSFDRTVALTYKIAKANPLTEFYLFPFCPLPKVPLITNPKIQDEIDMPVTFEEWGDLDYTGGLYFKLRSRSYQRKVNTVRELLALQYGLHFAATGNRPWPVRKLCGLMRSSILARLKHGFFILPVEMWALDLFKWMKSLLGKRKLVRGYQRKAPPEFGSAYERKNLGRVDQPAPSNQG